MRTRHGALRYSESAYVIPDNRESCNDAVISWVGSINGPVVICQRFVFSVTQSNNRWLYPSARVSYTPCRIFYPDQIRPAGRDHLALVINVDGYRDSGTVCCSSAGIITRRHAYLAPTFMDLRVLEYWAVSLSAGSYQQTRRIWR